MSDDLDDIEELDLTAQGQKYHDGPDSYQRQTIMRQLLNELLITNDWLEKERTHPFSSLEVIIEEVTPCSSSQQLENNLSTIKEGLKSHTEDEQESAIDSDEEDTRKKFSHNENSLKRETNMYTLKRYEKSDYFNSDDSSNSVRTGRTCNDSNTSNIDICFEVKESCNKPKEESARENKKIPHKSSFENTEELFSKFEKFLNDDERYVHKDKPKPQKRRNKFLTLNHNYDRIRNLKLKRKVCSTSNLSESDEACSFWDKNPEKTKIEPSADTVYKRKYCSTSNLSESDEPVSLLIKKPQKAANKNVSFTCLNTYCVNKKPDEIKPKMYCGDVDFVCHNKYTVKKPPDDNITVEELENRLEYFENQYHNLQDELNKARDAQLKLMQGNEVSSSEDEVRWCTSNKTFNLDRGDTKSMDDFNNTIDKTDKRGHSDSSPNDSFNSFKDNKSSEIYSDTDQTEYKDTEKVNEPSYSGNIFIAQKPSRDSGLQTYSASNSRENIDESIDEEFPKVMYASVNKTVSTQVSDDDWIRICTAKKDMATRGSLKLSLPNSSDDELLDEDEIRPTEKKVDFKPKTIIIHDYSDYSELSSKKSTSMADTTRTDLLEKDCSCFPCSSFVNFFIRFRR